MNEPSETPAANDQVAAAFERIRAEAKKRNGYVPDLTKQRAREQRAREKAAGDKGEKGTSISRRGIPTGPDGRRRPRPDNFEAFGSVLGGEIRARGWRKSIAGGWVNSHWSTLVGEKIAQHTKVEMLKETTLFISCDSTAWATNLRMMQRQILKSIAEHVGPDVITELKIFGPQVPDWRKGPLHVKGRGPRDTYG